MLAFAATTGCFEGPTSASTEKAAELQSQRHRNSVVVEIQARPAQLLADGSVRLFLRARCPRGFHVVEGPGTVNQGPVGQEVWGEGFFTTPCDGRWHRVTMRAFAPEQGFQRGLGRASVELMVENPETGEFLQDGDNRVVRIR